MSPATAVPHEEVLYHHRIGMDAGLHQPIASGGVARQRRLQKLRGLRAVPRPVYAEDDVSDDGSTSDGSLSSVSSSARTSPARSPVPKRKLSKEEEKRRKLEARKIRNRESAALSRKRKADLITDLEARVALLEEENSRLRNLAAAGGGLPHAKPLMLPEGVAQRTNIYKPAVETALTTTLPDKRRKHHAAPVLAVPDLPVSSASLPACLPAGLHMASCPPTTAADAAAAAAAATAAVVVRDDALASFPTAPPKHQHAEAVDQEEEPVEEHEGPLSFTQDLATQDAMMDPSVFDFDLLCDTILDGELGPDDLALLQSME